MARLNDLYRKLSYKLVHSDLPMMMVVDEKMLLQTTMDLS